MCVCVYVYTHTCTHTYTHTFSSARMRSIHQHTPAYVSIRQHTPMHTYRRTYLLFRTHARCDCAHFLFFARRCLRMLEAKAIYRPRRLACTTKAKWGKIK